MNVYRDSLLVVTYWAGEQPKLPTPPASLQNRCQCVTVALRKRISDNDIRSEMVWDLVKGRRAKVFNGSQYDTMIRIHSYSYANLCIHTCQ